MKLQYLASGAIIALLPAITAACDCTHIGGDSGRWVDRLSPSQAVKEMNPNPDGSLKCYTASVQGTICINGDAGQYSCMYEYAESQQSYHGDWFLWSFITCGGMTLRIT
ncbi:hypothetical protein IFR05_001727 [Cadophora sp. M221]|nr:hypothetical protein IFR05_001727 [Cadophora sp. M221]